jgi:hypothetical protein
MILRNIYTRKSDTFFRFTVVGRADCLPTPVNVRRWLKTGGMRGRWGQEQEHGQHGGEAEQDEGHCPRCGNARQQTLAHILNECTPNFSLMTRRHNQVAAVVKEAIINFIQEELRSDILENSQIQAEGLSEGLQALRPDMVFQRQPRESREEERQVTEILEFSCPYGYISRGLNTLERVYEQKRRKYAELAQELKRLRNEQVHVTAVIVSSMGAVYLPSLKGLQIILKCNDRELRKLGRRMSEAAIMGSMEIWRQYVRRVERGTQEGGNLMVEAEIEDVNRDDIERRRRGDEQMEIEANGELDHEEVVEVEMRYEQDYGRRGRGRERETEGLELSEDEMRASMDEYDRVVDVRARIQAGIQEQEEQEQGSDEGDGENLEI